ncbi:MAG: acylphosphatase [Proteobacteria bacterium]|nr:acylphosphatase [Pseudomonadota bacterium]MBU1648673.1 acylphosphatase [Pseudomonadota bacterium]MBU1985918.1 acylphosphatase [Pseudomonadota bacterium]
MKRIHAVVYGRVQGVFFRQTTLEQAKKLGLSGWVRNLADGTVEAEFQGDQEAVGRMLDWLPRGSIESSVVRVESREKEPVSGESEFIIKW